MRGLIVSVCSHRTIGTATIYIMVNSTATDIDGCITFDKAGV